VQLLSQAYLLSLPLRSLALCVSPLPVSESRLQLGPYKWFRVEGEPSSPAVLLLLLRSGHPAPQVLEPQPQWPDPARERAHDRRCVDRRLLRGPAVW
jgi:hypothetical protein